jgi:hypothetical protein
MTQIPTGDNCHRTTKAVGSIPDAGAKLHVVFIGKETISNRDHPPAPTVAVQEIEWHGGAMVQLVVLQTYDLVLTVG